MLRKPWLQHILAVDLCKSLHVSGPQFLYLSRGSENARRRGAAGGREGVHGSCVRAARLLREGRAPRVAVEGGGVGLRVPFPERKFWAGVWAANPRNHIHTCVYFCLG